jgi:cystathionine beta-lyase
MILNNNEVIELNRFDRVINRKGTDSAKWDYTKNIFGVDDVLPMWVADMDFPAPDEVIDALHTRVDHGIFGYTMPGNETEKSIQRWLKKRHDWEIADNIITYTPGIVTALSIAIQAYTESDDKIVVQPPVYYPFFDMPKKHNREVLFNKLHLNKDNRYDIDFEDLEEKLADQKTKMFILCNPHNPSGRVWSKEELTKIGQLCIKHDVLIVSDDIHSDLLLFGNRYTPIASISEVIANQTITCIAPSKTFNLAGLQSSAVLIANDSLKRKFNSVLQLHGLTSINTLGAEAMKAAYTHGQTWLDELICYFEESVLFIENYLKEHLPSVKVIRPEASYLVWLDVRDLEIRDDELKNLLLNKGKLALHLGSTFGENGSGFLRMNFACSRESLKEGLVRLVKALN